MILNVIIGIMVMIGLYMLYILKTSKYIYVNFSEVVGNQIVQHPTLYKASVSKDEENIKIAALNITRPYPPTRFFIPTNNKNKVVNICKIDSERYAYRIPSLHNEVIIEKRDTKGNIIKNEQGKPILEKLKWSYTDYVIEPDDRHWYQQEIKKNMERNRQKDSFMSKYGAILMFGIVFVFGIIVMHMNSKLVMESIEMWKTDKAEILNEAQNLQKEAQRTQQNLNWLIEKVSGQRVFDTEEEDRQLYLNQTTK
jgi:hypothetical protein